MARQAFGISRPKPPRCQPPRTVKLVRQTHQQGEARPYAHRHHRPAGFWQGDPGGVPQRGDTVSAVFCAPEKGRPDPLRVAAEERGVPVHQFPKLTDPAALEAMRDRRGRLGVMAYVTQFVPQDFCTIPTFGTIQFHPSLLPLHRGASSMSWAIICGRTETGFSIFRPTDGLDEGPVILMRSVPIEPEDTLGSLYFGKIFPMGVAGLVEVASRSSPARRRRSRSTNRAPATRASSARRNAHQLGQPRRYHLQPDPRL